MKALVLGNTNLAPLASELRDLDLAFGDHGDFLLQLSDPGSSAYDADLRTVALLLDGDLLYEAGLDPAELGSLLSAFSARRPEVSLVVSSWVLDPATTRSHAELRAPAGSAREWEEAGGVVLRNLSRDLPNLAILDWRLITESLGRERLLSPSFWYLGRIRYSKAGFERIGLQLRRLFDALHHRSCKVLVLDLDDTLWGGILGEDGASGLLLSEDGKGKIYRDLQRRVGELRERGILLALSSKNDFDAVRQVFDEHPMMRLRLDDFASVRVDWREKDQHLREIAAELELGLDSLVFVDDNPRERAWIEAELPDVKVPGFPEHPEDLPSWFIEEVVAPYFPTQHVTAEDRERPQRYAAKQKRSQAEDELGRESFLESLEIEIDTGLDPSQHLERAAQLTQRTNQFHLSGRRYSAVELAELAGSADCWFALASYEDRFGKEGIVGIGIGTLSSGDLETLAVSCRVLGRGVETALVEAFEAALRAAGRSMARARFEASGRNERARHFLAELGYTPLDEATAAEVRFERSLD